MKRIFVVEDEESIAELVNVILSSDEYEVINRFSAEDSFKFIGENDIDLFIVDLVLPGIHGFEFVRKVRKIPKFSRTPILIMTAKMEADDMDVVLTAGGDDLIIKPFKLEELKEKVVNLLNRI